MSASEPMESLEALQGLSGGKRPQRENFPHTDCQASAASIEWGPVFALKSAKPLQNDFKIFGALRPLLVG